MKKITIKLYNKEKCIFQVIGRNIEVTENSKQHMSTTFYASNQVEFDVELNKLKNEYQLFSVVMGKNSKNEVIVQLT